MKVLMTADAVGGVWTYVLELAHALALDGVRVTIAVMGPAPSAAQRAAAERAAVAVRAAPYRLEWMEDPWDDVARAGEWLLALERELAPDVVHLNGYAHAALPWRAPALVVAHSCVLSWWQAVKGEPAPAAWDRYRVEVTRGIAAASVVVAPTRAMLACVEAHYGQPRQAHVIPNGRDPARFPPGRKEPLVLSAGRLWDEAKNVAALARVAERLPWPVYVAGDDRSPGGAGNAHGALGGLHALGRLDEGQLADWLGRASVFALPARYEPFGLTPLEAALAGCALVLGDIASLREVWGDAATYVPPEDGEALALAVTALAADQARREELAGRARGRALKLTPDRMAEGYLAAYDALLAGRKSERSASVSARGAPPPNHTIASDAGGRVTDPLHAQA